MGRGSLRERGFLRFGGELVDESLLGLRVLLFREGIDDGGLHFVEGFGVGILLFFGLDDVVAELSANQV